MRMLNVLSRPGKVTACVTECDSIPPLSVTIAIRTKSGWADLFVKIRHTILPVFVFLHHNEDLGRVTDACSRFLVSFAEPSRLCYEVGLEPLITQCS